MLNKFLNLFFNLGTAASSLSIQTCLCNSEIGVNFLVFATYVNTGYICRVIEETFFPSCISDLGWDCYYIEFKNGKLWSHGEES